MKKKVRIKSLPQGYHMMPDGTIMKNSAHMAEGGFTNSLPPVPRGQANLEAERGETVVTNLTGDSVPEHYTIGGKRHSEGGTPLNLPPESFIFSDTRKMKIKDPEILKRFDKSYKKGGYTPAEIAKKYDINKYKKALYEDGISDKIAANTNEMMIDNYRNKLGQLAFVQESQKGFPQGVPAISEEFVGSIMDLPMAAYGGYLPKAQLGLRNIYGVTDYNPFSVNRPGFQFQPYSVNTNSLVEPEQTKGKSSSSNSSKPAKRTLPEGITQEEYDKLLSVIKGVSTYGNGRYRALAGDDYGYEDKKKLASSATLIGFDKKNSPFSQRKTPGYNDFYGGMKPADYERRIVEEMDGPQALEGLNEKQVRERAFKILGIEATPEMLSKSDRELYNDTKFFNETFYPAFTTVLPQDAYRPDLKDDKLMGYEHFDALRAQKTPEPRKIEDSSIQPTLKPNEYTGKKDSGSDTGEFWLQDKLRGMQDLRNRFGIKKYMPRNFRVDPVITPPTFFSPERELAANEEAANAITTSLAAFAGPQALSARASQIQGTGAAKAADILSRYNNQNVDVANRDVLRRDALMSAAAEFNTKGLSDFYDKTVIANQAYDNAKRAMDENIVNTVNNAITNAAYTSNLNTLYPQFDINPATGGYINFDREKARDITKRQLSSEQTDYQNKVSTFSQIVRDTGVSPDVAFKAVFGNTSKGMPSMPQTQEELDQYINQQILQGSMNMMYPGAQSMYGRTSQTGE